MINVYNALGIMSGTSLDGLDIALTTFQVDASNKWTFKPQLLKTARYPSELVNRLKKGISLSGIQLIELQNDWTNFVANEINQLKQVSNYPIHLIGNHGHTIFHQVNKELTFQLANNAALAVKTGIKVIGDFRSGDVALAGQGAPLVPIGDKLLFPEYEACLNLGGIANLSFNKNGKSIAYDCCPFNIPLNNYALAIGKEFDKGGENAAKGSVNELLLDELINLTYFKDTYPKSLGFEWINEIFLPCIDKYNLSTEDNLATLINLYIKIIALDIHDSSAKTILITGGGAYNTYFVNQLTQVCESQLIIPSKEIIEFKEAIIFAFLGVLRFREEHNTISSVTGAKKSHSAGGLYLP